MMAVSRRFPYLLLVLATLAVALCAHAEVLSLISDIHYDPLYGSEKGFKCTTAAAAALGQKSCDSPKALMDSVFADMSTRKNAYTLYSGDWQRHQFANSGLKANALWPNEADGFVGVVTSGTLDTAGQASVVACYGNNDVVPDYEFDWNTNNQADLEARVELLLNSTVLNPAEATTMKKCGYYSRNVSSTLRVLSLHSLLWANALIPAVPDTQSDPCGQFAFLEGELRAAKATAQKVIIVTHFPTSVDLYQVTSKGAFTDAETDMLWKPRFQQRYYGLLNQYADTVTLQLFGHTHLFIPIAHTASNVPAVVVPAISPIFGNTPSYLEAHFSDDWTVENIQQRFLVNAAWKSGMQVTSALGLPYGFANMTSLHEALSNLLTNDVVWNNYLFLHSGGERKMDTFPSGRCDSFCRAVTVCSMTNAYYNDVKTCVAAATTVPVPTLDPQVGGSIVTSVLILGVCFAIALIIVLSNIIPKIRTGEYSCDKIHFDWRAQLLGSTPKAEKQRRQAQQDGIDRHNADVEAREIAERDNINTTAVDVVDIHYTDIDRHSDFNARE